MCGSGACRSAPSRSTRRGSISGSGPPAATQVDVAIETERACGASALDAEGNGYFSRGSWCGRTGRALPLQAGRRRATATPIRRRGFSPKGRTAVGDRRSVDVSPGPIRRWRGVVARRPGDLRDARRHVHAARARGARRRRNCRELARARHHGDRDDAGRRVRRALRLGLRRRRSLRARRTCTARPTICARFVDARARARPRRHPRRRLQPPRPGRQLPARSSRRDYFTDRYENEWGDAINFDGPDAGAGARVLRRQRRLLDRRVPPRRPAPRRDAADLRRLAASTSLAAIGRARARGGRRRARSVIVAENEPQDTRLVRPLERGRLRPRRAVERRLPPQRAWSR